MVRSTAIGQTVAHLGELDERGRLEARGLARRLIGAPEQTALFDDGSDHLTAPVRLKGIRRIERSRRFGDSIRRWRCGAASVLRRQASGCFRRGRNASHGRRWRPC
jgi:hypothetical protein